MTQKSLNNGCAMNAALETTLAVELFLNENYCFRRNVLNGKVETSTDKRRAPLQFKTPEAFHKSRASP